VKLSYILLPVALVAVAGATWAATSFTVIETPDGYLVLNKRQAKECEEGGGCAVFSQREFVDAMNKLMSRVRPNGLIS
jgi:hypothetical protein